MKNLSIVLNAVLFIAVAVLYFLHFTKTEVETGEESVSAADSLMPEKLTIVYVMEDSLLSNYEYFQDISAQLDQRRQSLEQDYRSRAEGLQSEIANFQQNAGNMTMNQARAVEEDLMKKQQNLVRYQESLSQTLMQEEAEMNRKLFERVSGFLEEFATEKGYTVVMNYRPGNALLYGHDAMDVTREVVSGLNKAYEASKKGEKTGNRKTADKDSASVQ